MSIEDFKIYHEPAYGIYGIIQRKHKKGSLMIIKKAPFSIYFGDSADCLFPAAYLALPERNILEVTPFAKLQKDMGLTSLHFLHQVHGVDGLEVADAGLAVKPFGMDGDFLITNLRNVGLGVMTADCLPIVAYDPDHCAIGIAHAGWRGSVQNITHVMLEKMAQSYGSKPHNMFVYFGPSAQPCCYRVDAQFVDNFKNFAGYERVFYSRADGLFFDLPAFNRMLLEQCGIRTEAINLEYASCTICTKRYCSYRRNNAEACRQMTVVSLL